MEFKFITEVPKGLTRSEVERVVELFIRESHIKNVNATGLFNQILMAIASVLYAKRDNVYFWVAEDQGKIKAWALTHTSTDVDNSLSYWMTDAWVDKEYRQTPLVKQWYNDLRKHARELDCKHILIPSSRNTKAYLRFLGRNWHEHLTILKEDI